MRNGKLMTCVAAMLGLAFLATAALAADGTGEGFVSLFDGKTLDGWEGKSPFWSVRDGAITGQTTAENPTKGNTFLIWRGGKVADFELRLKFRMEGGNSGIQYRSTEMDNFVVGGYQADFDAGNNYTGILYEERGRGILVPRCKKLLVREDGSKEVVGSTCDQKDLVASLKKGGWNEYVVIAQGNHLIQKINGFTTVDLTDQQKEKSRSEGILALQLHAGPPMLVQFKDIQLKPLK
ncbi:MAG: DUF1080 domain-containing protein [Candidatus Anammoximicrobium sp.]|nr:DUF1080 domain-containing protein [Candidatus Anammoximicrobium sp.]